MPAAMPQHPPSASARVQHHRTSPATSLAMAAIALACSFTPAIASAQTFKCVDAQGRLAYQQAPCAAHASGELLVDDVTRQREVARQERRDAIAQERIDHRQLQQQEMQRLRERVRAAGGQQAPADNPTAATPSTPDTASLLGLADNETLLIESAPSTAATASPASQTGPKGQAAEAQDAS